MKYGAPIDLGNVLEGRKPIRYVVGYHYDFIYRLTPIKATSDYSSFYIMCPLRGPVRAGKTLKSAIRRIDREHAAEGAFMPGEGPKKPENVVDITVLRVFRRLVEETT